MAKYKISIIIISICLSIFLGFVFSGNLILPQAFNIGGITVHYYGLIMSLAVFSGWALARRRSEKYQMEKNKADDIIFLVIIFGFIGARFYHVLSSLSYYLQNPLDVLKVWQGGLSIYGAVLGGLFAVWVFSKSYKLSAKSLLDWLTPSLILGQIIGRFGNLFNYELYGFPTTLPWKMFVPEIFRPSQFVAQSFFHPLFLYEALWNALVLFFVYFLQLKEKKPPLFLWYILLYNIGRIFTEILKIEPVYIGPFKQNLLLSCCLILVSGFLLIFSKKHAKIS